MRTPLQPSASPPRSLRLTGFRGISVEGIGRDIHLFHSGILPAGERSHASGVVATGIRGCGGGKRGGARRLPSWHLRPLSWSRRWDRRVSLSLLPPRRCSLTEEAAALTCLLLLSPGGWRCLLLPSRGGRRPFRPSPGPPLLPGATTRLRRAALVAVLCGTPQPSRGEKRRARASPRSSN